MIECLFQKKNADARAVLMRQCANGKSAIACCGSRLPAQANPAPVRIKTNSRNCLDRRHGALNPDDRAKRLLRAGFAPGSASAE